MFALPYFGGKKKNNNENGSIFLKCPFFFPPTIFLFPEHPRALFQSQKTNFLCKCCYFHSQKNLPRNKKSHCCSCSVLLKPPLPQCCLKATDTGLVGWEQVEAGSCNLCHSLGCMPWCQGLVVMICSCHICMHAMLFDTHRSKRPIGT